MAAALAPTPKTYSFPMPDAPMTKKVIPSVGNPHTVSLVCRKWRGLQKESYQVILDAYRGQALLSRFIVNVPQSLPPALCVGYVKAIYQAVMQDNPFHQTYSRHSAQPLALAGTIEFCAPQVKALKDNDAQIALAADRRLESPANEIVYGPQYEALNRQRPLLVARLTQEIRDIAIKQSGKAIVPAAAPSNFCSIQ